MNSFTFDKYARLIVAICLVSTIGIGLIISWLFSPMSPEGMNKQCILGKTKHLAGILFGGCVDIWHVSHFILWLIIGILVPSNYLVVFVISVSWELFEHFVFRKYRKCTSFTCGRFEDIILNMLGYTLGSQLNLF